MKPITLDKPIDWPFLVELHPYVLEECKVLAREAGLPLEYMTVERCIRENLAILASPEVTAYLQRTAPHELYNFESCNHFFSRADEELKVTFLGKTLRTFYFPKHGPVILDPMVMLPDATKDREDREARYKKRLAGLIPGPQYELRSDAQPDIMATFEDFKYLNRLNPQDFTKAVTLVGGMCWPIHIARHAERLLKEGFGILKTTRPQCSVVDSESNCGEEFCPKNTNCVSSDSFDITRTLSVSGIISELCKEIPTCTKVSLRVVNLPCTHSNPVETLARFLITYLP
jgi:hypothetical protein